MPWHVATDPVIYCADWVIRVKHYVISLDSNRENSLHLRGAQITNLNVKTFWKLLGKKLLSDMQMFQLTLKDPVVNVKAVKWRRTDLNLDQVLEKLKSVFKSELPNGGKRGFWIMKSKFHKDLNLHVDLFISCHRKRNRLHKIISKNCLRKRRSEAVNLLMVHSCSSWNWRIFWNMSPTTQPLTKLLKEQILNSIYTDDMFDRIGGARSFSKID